DAAWQRPAQYAENFPPSIRAINAPATGAPVNCGSLVVQPSLPLSGRINQERSRTGKGEFKVFCVCSDLLLPSGSAPLRRKVRDGEDAITPAAAGRGACAPQRASQPRIRELRKFGC